MREYGAIEQYVDTGNWQDDLIRRIHAFLHERSPVVRVEPGVVTTARGRVRAPEVVVAANAWMTGWRPLRGR